MIKMKASRRKGKKNKTAVPGKPPLTQAFLLCRKTPSRSWKEKPRPAVHSQGATQSHCHCNEELSGASLADCFTPMMHLHIDIVNRCQSRAQSYSPGPRSCRQYLLSEGTQGEQSHKQPSSPTCFTPCARCH